MTRNVLHGRTKPDGPWQRLPVAAAARDAAAREPGLRRMSTHGILVLYFSPRQIRTDPARAIAIIRDTLAAGAARPELRLIAREAA
jgi:hypothetical protein